MIYVSVCTYGAGSQNMNKKLSFKSIFLLILSLYTFVGYIIFAFTKKIIPIPLGEAAAAVYGYFYKGNTVFGCVLIALVLFCIVFTVYFALKPKKKIWAVRIFIVLVFLIDSVIHQYAFFITKGFV